MTIHTLDLEWGWENQARVYWGSVSCDCPRRTRLLLIHIITSQGEDLKSTKNNLRAAWVLFLVMKLHGKIRVFYLAPENLSFWILNPKILDFKSIISFYSYDTEIRVGWSWTVTYWVRESPSRCPWGTVLSWGWSLLSNLTPASRTEILGGFMEGL